MPNLINSYSLSSVIGIGTDTPNQNLTVVGGISSSAVVYDKIGNSNQWNTAYTYLTGNSATFAPYSYVNNTFLPLSGGTLTGFLASLSSVQIYGNLTVNGNLTATGTTTFANTKFTTTSALSVINFGVGPALYVQQAVGPSDIASFYNSGGVEVLHIGNIDPITYQGKVGINVSAPNKELTVKGSISATGDFDTQGQVNAYIGNFTNPGVNQANFLALNVVGAGSQSVYQELQNTYAGVSASTDISIFNDTGNYLDLGINSSLYNGSLFSPTFNVVKANDAYAYNAGSGNLALGTAGSGDVIMFTGGTLSGTHASGGSESLRIKSSGNVGIGTTTPNQLLTVQGNISSSSIVYDATNNSAQWNSAYNTATTYQSASGSFVPNTAINSLTGNWNTAYRSVSSQPYTLVDATNSINTIRGSNIASGYYSNVAGGNSNNASGGNSNVAGGYGNTASGSCSNVAGGAINTASNYYSNVAGGFCNTASGYISNVAGGFGNTASGGYSFVGGGYNNTTSGYGNGDYSVVVGGLSNYASYASSFVGGGSNNRVVGTDSNVGSSIVGGNHNCIYDTSGAFIGGGENNYIESNGCICVDSSIVGGCFNKICGIGLWSLIGGGACNLITNLPADCAGCSSGVSYTFFSETSGSSIISGKNNCITPAYGNTILSNSTITHGNNNQITTTISGNYNTGSSYCFYSCSIVNNVKIGGSNNIVTSNSSGINQADSGVPIYPPINSCINNISILNGTNNCINSYSGYYTTGSGDPGDPVIWHSKFSTVDSATIVNGCSNTINGCYSCPSYTTILNGCNNKICGINAVYGSSILGGINNISNADNTFILGSNIIATTPNYTYVNNLLSQGAIIASGGNSNIWNSNYTSVSSNFNVDIPNYYMVNTSSGIVRGTLPASPSVGQSVTFIDPFGTWNRFPLVLLNNGLKISSLTEALTANTNNAKFQLVYVGNIVGWKPF
jgi:hypothetical protein